MPRCGSQVILCDLPIRFDTYSGCSHLCKYCFAVRKGIDRAITKDESPNTLRNWIGGKRTGETEWCDWDIPLHWGGMSDPFQPVELEMKVSFECLKVFAETKYPFVVSTKGTRILARPEYLELLDACNAVVQVSLVSPKFDILEPGAPPFEERLSDIVEISKHCKRVIVRIQPYIREVRQDILDNIPRYVKNGIYGITIEGIKYFQKRRGFIKVGADYVYPKEILAGDFEQIRDVCRKNGLHFFCAENRLRDMGESLCCCGIADLEGFRTNCANIVHGLAEGGINYTDRMKKVSGACFKAMGQDTMSSCYIRDHSFAEVMDLFAKDRKVIESLS